MELVELGSGDAVQLDVVRTLVDAVQRIEVVLVLGMEIILFVLAVMKIISQLFKTESGFL